MKFLLVFNPAAAKGRARRLFPEVQEAFREKGLECETLVSSAGAAVADELACRELGDFDGVIAAGGDGTVFEVLNGLYRHEAKDRKPLGVIPLGTGNAFARELGLFPGEWRKALDLIAGGGRRCIDVGRVECAGEVFHFLNIVGMGFVVGAGKASQKLKFLGPGAYTLGTLWQTLRLKSYPLRIEVDGRLIEQDNVLVEIANTQYTGTSFLIAPGALMDDGRFDVVLLRKLSRLRLLKLFPTIYSGTHVQFDEITLLRGRHIRILEPAGFLLAPDGEFRGQTPAEISCLHQDLEIFSS